MARKVLAISSYKIFPAHSGGQKAIVNFYRYLCKEVKVVLAGTQNNDLAETYEINVLKVFSASPFRYVNLFYYFKLKKIIYQNNIDTVIVEHPYMGVFGIMLQKILKIKLIIRSHNIEGLRFKDLRKWWWKILLYYEKWVHSKADFSFFITEEDRSYALKNFSLKKEKTTVITYGTIIEKSYTETQKAEYIKQLKSTFNIPISHTLLLFNGAFGYEPNDRALDLLLNEIMPLLLQRDKHFTLLICGKNIPQDYNRYQSENIIIKGFIENIDEVFKGAEIFLNPIWLGGGIKTKLVEALAFGSSAVSFRSGALGIPKNTIGEKLSIAEDKNILQFAEEIIHQRNTLNIDTPNSFYEHFYWGNIAKKAAQKL